MTEILDKINEVKKNSNILNRSKTKYLKGMDMWDFQQRPRAYLLYGYLHENFMKHRFTVPAFIMSQRVITLCHETQRFVPKIVNTASLAELIERIISFRINPALSYNVDGEREVETQLVQ